MVARRSSGSWARYSATVLAVERGMKTTSLLTLLRLRHHH